MKLKIYFIGVTRGAYERRCKKIVDAYPNTRWVSSIGPDSGQGQVCITYNVPDASAQAINDLIVKAGFSITPILAS
jgi:hypothetical protein